MDLNARGKFAGKILVLITLLPFIFFINNENLGNAQAYSVKNAQAHSVKSNVKTRFTVLESTTAQDHKTQYKASQDAEQNAAQSDKDAQKTTSETGRFYAGTGPNVNPATVQLIIGSNNPGHAVSSCSGAYVGPGRVLTASHCFHQHPQGPVEIYDRDSQFQGTLVDIGVNVYRLEDADLALITTDGTDHPWAPAASIMPVYGQPLYQCGLNLIIGKPNSINEEVERIAGKESHCAAVNMINQQTDKALPMLRESDWAIATQPFAVEIGDSGGPIYNLDGQVVGITTEKTFISNETQAIYFNYGISVSPFRSVLEPQGAVFAPPCCTGNKQIVNKPLPQGLNRFAGADRIETALGVWHTLQQSGQIDTALLASANLPADALVSTQLRSVYSAGLLLTKGGNALEEPVWQAINAGNIKRVITVGGLPKFSAAQRAQLQKRGVEIIELIGADRFETARLVAQHRDEKLGLPKAVIVADGMNFPDALAAGAWAGIAGYSLVLSSTDLPPATAQYVNKICAPAGPGDCAGVIYTVGGPATRAFYGTSKNQVIHAIQGENRYETALMVAGRWAESCAVNGWTLASGRNFPDALSGGFLAIATRKPLLLVPAAGQLPSILENNWSQYSQGNIVGGPVAISDQDVAWALQP